MSQPLSGQISDRLRRMFPSSAPGWTPQRPGRKAATPAVSKNITGSKFTGRKPK